MLIRRTLRMMTVLTATCAVALTGAIAGGAGTAQADQAQASSQKQLLFYNHAYSVVDRETADAVENSAYLREFANFEVRTTTGGGMTWKGRYLKGRETYIELFGENDLPGQDALYGSAGLAVSADRAGDLAKATTALAALGISDPATYRQTRDFGDGVPIPWFDTIRTTAAQYEAFDPWAMEYFPEYFADPRSQTEPESHPGDVSRERYLPDTYADRLMRDITYLRIGVPARDLANTIPLLKAGGFDVATTGGGAIASGGGTTIQLDSVAREQAGLKQVSMSLNRAVETRHEERIGRSTLAVGPGARAEWTFDAPR
ncbi:hypothetical protein SAMN05444920_120143 [Nonomuraea solani]|uniref:Uncharacterized protein n=1 Tax=Nonomuraea solani TaxID=1144553 RepID=A0A1H6EX30_9ACTN|nr:DUF5829 family protein [Nonomuraea solani]SEH01439.1 hypothetical protein SAMN05444920_120143 [Nonomuraea solani]